MGHLYQRTISYKAFYTFLFHVKSRGEVRMNLLRLLLFYVNNRESPTDRVKLSL